MFIRSELEEQIRDVSKSLASAEAVIESISELFPDNACHKHPETGVSLLDDVSDVITKYNDLDGECYNLHIQFKATTARAEAAERERDEARAHAADLRGALDDLLPPRREHLTEPERRAYAVLDAMKKEATDGR